MFLHFCIRSKDEWVVEQNEYRFLKASAGDDPLHPPTSGWFFKNTDTREFEEDKSLTCAPSTIAAASCSLIVTLGGRAAEIHGQCQGVYNPTELVSMGRPVSFHKRCHRELHNDFCTRSTRWRAQIKSICSLIAVDSTIVGLSGLR